MKLFESKRLVQAFRMPLWGKASDEVAPKWLITRLQSGDLVINSLGGVTMTNRWGHQQCAAGDTVLLTDRDTIEFATPEEFAQLEEVSVDQLLRAA